MAEAIFKTWFLGLGFAGCSCAAAWAAAEAPSDPAFKSQTGHAPSSHPLLAGWEGALGPVVSGNQQDRGLVVRPGYYLRYKRVSISNTGLFAVRRTDDVFNGLGLDLGSDTRWRFNLGLRLDTGSRVTNLPALAGHDRVRSTVRLRAASTYQLMPYWRAGVGWSTDLLGRGGGQVFNAGISREAPLRPNMHWVLGMGLSAADARYQRARFGVSETQSALSGLAVYQPGGGLLDASVTSSVRRNIHPDWLGFVEVSAWRRMGPQLQSPLATWTTNWGVSVGIARRF